jgi:hypothetical protein
VTWERTGEPRLDGRAFAASFERASFTVSEMHSNLPADCIDQWSLELGCDFEGFGLRRLDFQEVRTPDCAARPGDYCKGQLAAELGEPLVP